MNPKSSESSQAGRDRVESVVGYTIAFFHAQAEKRAHHNALERKRRDHIKESFHSLRDSVPSLQGEKVCVCVSERKEKKRRWIAEEFVCVCGISRSSQAP